MREQKVAIVTTLKQADKVLKTFLEHHFSIGFDHIFLFFDDPEDLSIRESQNHPNVTVYRNDAQLQALWKGTNVYRLRKDFLPFLTSEVMSRQVLNVAVAIQECLRLGIDWLLHIDIDELFYSPSLSVKEHYLDLTAKRVDMVRYLNHEAIPEKTDIENYFKEVTLFKKNAAVLNDLQIDTLKAVNLFDPYFSFYATGKSAARVNDRLLPASVHDFFGDEQVSSSPSILHFPCCGFECFWNKYVILGRFSDKWFGQFNIKDILPIHVRARDVVGSNDVALGKEFYRQIIMRTGPEMNEQLVEQGIYFRI